MLLQILLGPMRLVTIITREAASLSFSDVELRPTVSRMPFDASFGLPMGLKVVCVVTEIGTPLVPTPDGFGTLDPTFFVLLQELDFLAPELQLDSLTSIV